MTVALHWGCECKSIILLSIVDHDVVSLCSKLFPPCSEHVNILPGMWDGEKEELAIIIIPLESKISSYRLCW